MQENKKYILGTFSLTNFRVYFFWIRKRAKIFQAAQATLLAFICVLVPNRGALNFRVCHSGVCFVFRKTKLIQDYLSQIFKLFLIESRSSMVFLRSFTNPRSIWIDSDSLKDVQDWISQVQVNKKLMRNVRNCNFQ